eukprot:scaffold309844_cov15-Tisochrysis_lutea.AAC.1
MLSVPVACCCCCCLLSLLLRLLLLPAHWEEYRLPLLLDPAVAAGTPGTKNLGWVGAPPFWVGAPHTGTPLPDDDVP